MPKKPSAKVSTKNASNGSDLTAVAMPKVSNPAQFVLPLDIDRQVEIGGVWII